MIKIIVPITFVVVILGTLIRLNFFRVNYIVIQRDGADCITTDPQKDLNIKNQNIFTIDKSVMTSRLARKYPCIKDLVLTKRLPSSVLVTVEGRAPVFVISQSSDSTESAVLNTNYLVDSTGLVFEEGDRAGMPKVEDESDQLKVGFSIGDKASKINRIEGKLKELDVSIANSSLIENDLLITADNPQSVVFSLNKDVEEELASLQLILQAGKMNSEGTSGPSGGSKLMERVDLRFDKPVVVYSPKKHQ